MDEQGIPVWVYVQGTQFGPPRREPGVSLGPVESGFWKGLIRVALGAEGDGPVVVVRPPLERRASEPPKPGPEEV